MRTVTITHKTGLHARPAGMVTKQAQGYQSDVLLIKGDKEYNAKSIMAVLSMGVTCGDQVTIRAVGSDAEEAEAAMEALIHRINEE